MIIIVNRVSEGKIIISAAPDKDDEIAKAWRKMKYGKEARIIGEVRDRPKGKVILETVVGGKRVLETSIGELYPRIC